MTPAEFFTAHPAATWRDYHAYVRANGLSGFQTPQAVKAIAEIARAKAGA